MKKIITMSLVFCMLLSYTACGCSHNYESKITKNSTCKETGITTYTCTICNHSYTEEIEKLSSHNYSTQVTKEATCKETGITTYTCTVCEDTYNKSIAKTNNHTYSLATCTKPKECIICGTSSGSININAHSGLHKCDLCHINYFDTLKSYTLMYGTTKKDNSGDHCFVLEKTLYLVNEIYVLKIGYYHDSELQITLKQDNGAIIGLIFEDTSGEYLYEYTHVQYKNQWIASDFLKGTITASNITSNTYSLPYTLLQCNDTPQHSNDYILLKGTTMLKLLLTELNNYLTNNKIGINISHFGFTNFNS